MFCILINSNIKFWFLAQIWRDQTEEYQSTEHTRFYKYNLADNR